MRPWGNRNSHILLMGRGVKYYNQWGVQLALPFKMTNAFDLAIPLTGIHPTNMLIYVNDTHKRLFIDCNSTRLETTQMPNNRELFNKWANPQEGVL